MENKRKALGKGLEQLLNSEPLNLDTLNNYEKEIVENTSKSDIIEISIDDIRSNPHQPREYFDEEALKAQAIVARTYTIHKIKNVSKHENADICDSSLC